MCQSDEVVVRTSEFGELLPRRIAMPSEEDLLAFTVTGAWMTVVAQYIIGLAAALSGDVDYAQALYESALESASTISADSPVAAKIISRIPQRVAELHEARANAALILWRETKDPAAAVALKSHLDNITPQILSGLRYVHLRAVAAFLVDRDVDQALSILDSARDRADALWYWNAGFLYAYKGNLKKATQLYRNGTLIALPAEIPAQLEEFITHILITEPEKTQLHYCLGLLNRDVKGDSIRALEEFDSFLAKTPEGVFERDKVVVKKWKAALMSANNGESGNDDERDA